MNQSGMYVKNLSGEMSYQSFNPNPLPPVNGIEISERMLKLVSEANTKLAELNAAGNLIPNADLFISMYVRKEPCFCCPQRQKSMLNFWVYL